MVTQDVAHLKCGLVPLSLPTFDGLQLYVSLLIAGAKFNPGFLSFRKIALLRATKAIARHPDIIRIFILINDGLLLLHLPAQLQQSRIVIDGLLKILLR